MQSSDGGARSKPQGWELRAQVTEGAFSFLDRQAKRLGRARAWHVGLVVEAFASVAQHLTEVERAQFDVLLREPEQLLALMRRVLRPLP